MRKYQNRETHAVAAPVPVANTEISQVADSHVMCHTGAIADSSNHYNGSGRHNDLQCLGAGSRG